MWHNTARIVDDNDLDAYPDSDHWWSIGLPMLVKKLLWERSTRLSERDGHVAWLERRELDLEDIIEKQDLLIKNQDALISTSQAALREVEEELTEAQAQAKGREAGLLQALCAMRGT